MRADDLGILSNYSLSLQSVGDKSVIYVRSTRDWLSSGLLMMSLDSKLSVVVCSFWSSPMTSGELSSNRSKVMSVGRLSRSWTVIVHEQAFG